MRFDALSFVMGQQAGKASGGGSVEGVHFVTFMNEDGTTELYKRPVADGDDCADPVERGYISEPTKESTAQYNYTHVGWSASPNGALDENILKAVTADKTVYANFAAVLRYYTVTYYDSDGTTVLKTESLAYGAMPNYVAEKDGYNFDGWVPVLATVTGNASYAAQFSEKLTFAGASWADIARISEAGEAATHFAVGDERTIPYGDTTLTAKIIGFNHDDLSDGSGKAGISIMVFDCVDKVTFETASEYKAYPDVKFYSFLHETALPKLEPELQSVIKSVKKLCDKACSSDNLETKSVDMQLWLPSASELASRIGGNFIVKEYLSRQLVLGNAYSYFSSRTFTGVLKNHFPTGYSFWLRGNVHSGSWSYFYVTQTLNNKFGGSFTSEAGKSFAMEFGFCI